MTESNQSKTNFAGTYFERDSILRLARLADIFSWVILAYYTAQFGLALIVYILQMARGLIYAPGYTDILQQILWMVQPLTPGLLYFVGIQAIGKFLLIMMDIEDNLRRAARGK